LAIALSVSADLLLFDKDEYGPDDALGLQLEALRQFDRIDPALAGTSVSAFEWQCLRGMDHAKTRRG